MTKLLDEVDAKGRTEEIYGEIKKNFGMIPNFFRAQAAVDEAWLALNWERWKAIMGNDRSLSRKTKELVAVAVSIVNGCEYCKAVHENVAKAMGASEEEIIELKEVIELFCSFNSIADSLEIPIDQAL